MNLNISFKLYMLWSINNGFLVSPNAEITEKETKNQGKGGSNYDSKRKKERKKENKESKGNKNKDKKVREQNEEKMKPIEKK
jgi:hypothetical protein